MRAPLPLVEAKQKATALTVICFLAYAVSYLGRLNYSAAMPEMLAEELITRTQGGTIATIYFMCYGVGQLINGSLADRCDPVRQVTIGMLLSALMNFLMYTVKTPVLMYLSWGINGYAQSLFWAPTFLLLSQSVPLKWRKKAIFLLNTAPMLGAVSAYLLSTITLGYRSWENGFLYATLFLLGTAVIWNLVCHCSYKGAVSQKLPQTADRPADVCDLSTLKRLMLLSGSAALILPALIFGMLKDGITNWLPTYLIENFSVSAQTAVITAMVLPLINVLGLLLEYHLMQKVHHEPTCIMILFGIASTILAILQILSPRNPMVTTVCLAIVTAAMMGIGVIFCSDIPLRFAEVGRSATVSGFFNSCSYIGTAISMYVLAWVSSKYGWAAAQLVWLASCFASVVLCGAAIPAWNHFFSLGREGKRHKLGLH